MASIVPKAMSEQNGTQLARANRPGLQPKTLVGSDGAPTAALANWLWPLKIPNLTPLVKKYKTRRKANDMTKHTCEKLVKYPKINPKLAKNSGKNDRGLTDIDEKLAKLLTTSYDPLWTHFFLRMPKFFKPVMSILVSSIHEGLMAFPVIILL